MNYALINNQTNIVENIIVLDEGSTWTPPDNYYLVSLENTEAGIGWMYNPDTKEWTPPAPSEPPVVLDEAPGTTPNVIS